MMFRCDTFTPVPGGTALVCGPAPCLLDDLVPALLLRPGADLLAVNEAPSILERRRIEVAHVVTYDALFAAQARQYVSKWAPLSRSAPIHCRDKQSAEIPAGAVDHWWSGPGLACSSGIFAAVLARSMGYYEAILVGCPMVPGSGYHRDMAALAGRPHPRVGSGFDDRHRSRELVAKFQRHTLDLREAGALDHVRSMSGWTAEHLGEPT